MELASANEISWTLSRKGFREKCAVRWTRVFDDIQVRHEEEDVENEETVTPVARASRSSKVRPGRGAVWRAVARPEESPTAQPQAVPCGNSSKGGHWGQVRKAGRRKVNNRDA